MRCDEAKYGSCFVRSKKKFKIITVQFSNYSRPLAVEALIVLRASGNQQAGFFGWARLRKIY